MCNLRIDEAAYILVSNPWFDRVIIATIVINCIFLALVDPTKSSDEQETHLIIGDYVFSGIFIAELLAKWLALSIPTYFKDKWNWVDFIVVMESIISLVLKAVKSTSSLNISALRGLRVLRPLRAVTYIQQVKLLFETVISASKVVTTLLLCIGCVLLFFGNVGYTFWAGVFDYTCMDEVTSDIMDEGEVCGSGYTCPDGYTCDVAGDFELNHGVTSYEDIWHALLQAFQVVSLDGWQEVMWHTQDAAGEVTWIYFIVLIVLGNIFLVSMFPAVVSTKLEAAIEHEEERKRKIIQAEKGKGSAREKKGTPASEFELLLNEYSKIEADEIVVIERMAAIRRGYVRQQPEEEPLPPPWTPFPRNPLANRLRKAVLLELGPFSILIYVVIFLNALVLCLDHKGASDRTERALSGLNEAFTALFVVEMVIKLGLLGPHTYLRDGYNVFDFAITWLGLVEITVQVAGFFTGLRIIRIFRIARVLRLASLGKLGRAEFNPSPQVDLTRMVGIITTSIPWVANIYAVQLLLMYTFAVLGMQFFGGTLPDVEESLDNSIRFNYNSFGKAAVTILDLFTGNRWSEVMFDTVGAAGEQTGIIFYVVWLVLSRWLVVAMVTTVLFYRIGVDTEDYLKVAAKNSMRSVFALERAFMQCHKSHVFLTWRRRYEEATGNRTAHKGRMKLLEYTPPPAHPGAWQNMVTSPKSLLLFGPKDNPIRELCQWLTATVSLDPCASEGQHQTEQKGKSLSTSRDSFNRCGASRARRSVGDFGYMDGGQHLPYSTGMRTDENKEPRWRSFLGRKRLHRLVRFAFETAVLSAVVATMIAVCFDVEISSGRRDPGANEPATTSTILETFAVSVFLAEVVLLAIARGFVLIPGAYLRVPQDALNFALAILSAVCLWALPGESWGDLYFAVSVVKALRGLTVIRLLKAVRLSQELSIVLKAIRSCGRALCLAGGILLFFWLQWSIVGLQVWKGTFGFCSDAEMASAKSQDDYYVYRTGTYTIEGQSDCEAADFEWKTAAWNFDNFGQALRSVFIIFTFNGWQDILFSAINARVSSEGLNAEAWNSTWAGLFFLCVLMTSLVLVLLIVSVIFSMYTFLNLTGRGQRLSSLKQAFWAMYKAKLEKVQPDTVPACPRDAHSIRRFLFGVAVSPRWRIALALLISANVVARFLVGSKWMHYEDAPIWIHVQEAAFAAVFVLEWACRALAFGGVRAVTRSPFQIADFVSTLILALAFVDEVVFLSGSVYSSSPLWKVVNAISMIRLVRLGHMFPDVQEFLLVTVKSSSVVFPLLLILALLTYLWSVCGVVLFGNDTYLADLFGDGEAWEAVNRHQGFFGVAQGMQTMLGVATTPGSDGWVALMQRYQDVTDTRWRWGVVLFFTSYAFVTRFLMVNLFMMTLLFKYKTHSNDKVGVAIEQVNQFKHAWMSHAFTYTKEYRQICAGQLVALLQELPPPLGVGGDGSHYDCQILAKKVLRAMGVDVVAHIPAKYLSDVLSLRSGGGDRNGSKAPADRPGHVRLGFSKVLVAVHRIALFGVTLDEERVLKENRDRARMHLSVLKLGVHRFLATGVKRRAPSRDPLNGSAVAECSLLRTQLPATFMVRSSMALTAEFLRWRDHVELRGCDHAANQEGQCLLNATLHEVDVSTALEQLMARLFSSHVGDRALFSRLADVRQHIVTLRELRAKLDTARSDYLHTTWDGGSLRVRQTIDDERSRSGVTAVCASMDGVWIFCTTEGGILKVFKREKGPRARNGKKSRLKDSYALVQSVGIKGDRAGGTKGLCAACSPDGFMVVVGCSDSSVRSFSQDTLGMRRAIQAMQAEGNRGRKPTVSYRPDLIGKGHKSDVRCVAWLDPGFFFTGGADGTVCMWRKHSLKRPVQTIDVCRSVFSCNAVSCLALWRTTYDLDMLASCIDVDDTQEVEPPAYVLAGDGDGFLSVLPARMDSKFFAVDVWKPTWKQQVQSGGGAVTAVEVAWGRVYTASGAPGLIKTWLPLWADETNEKLLGLEQVGQYPVHSGAVSSIVYARGLLFSAGQDMSVVTWYPARQCHGGTQINQANISTSPRESPEDTADGNKKYNNITKPGDAPVSSPATLTGPRDGPVGVGVDGKAGGNRANVEHVNDPGFVAHVAGVVGIAVIPGALVSADLGGRLVVRGPETFIESHRAQVVPGDEDIQRVRPLAIDVLKARGRPHRSPAVLAAVLGTGPGASADFAAFVSQAAQDHLGAVRFLLRAKGKRRLQEEMRIEKQRAADLNTARIFAHSMGQERRKPGRGRFARPLLRAGRVPRGPADSVRRSLSIGLKARRRRSLMQSVSVGNLIEDGISTREGGISQTTADVSKIVEMDGKPGFLDTTDLELLADHPEVYLAHLMSHFFPGRDLTRQSTCGPSETGSTTSCQRTARSDDAATTVYAGRGACGGRDLRGGGIKPFRGLRSLTLAGGADGKRGVGGNTGTGAVEMAPSAAPLAAATMSNLQHPPRVGGTIAQTRPSNLRNTVDGAEEEPGGGEPGVRGGNDDKGCAATARPTFVALLERARRAGVEQDQAAAQAMTSVDVGKLQAGSDTRETEPPPEPMSPLLVPRDGTETASPTPAPRPPASPLFSPDTLTVSENDIDQSTGCGDNDDAHVSVATASTGREKPNTVMPIEPTTDSFVGDHLSAGQERQRGNIIVLVPQVPRPGVWAASVDFAPERDIAWVLAEGLRLYAMEHQPITRHRGLARRPQLVERQREIWGLFTVGGGRMEWEISPALPATSPVHSVLVQGEELVVLVEGFDPVLAFDRRMSMCVPAPPFQATYEDELCPVNEQWASHERDVESGDSLVIPSNAKSVPDHASTLRHSGKERDYFDPYAPELASGGRVSSDMVRQPIVQRIRTWPRKDGGGDGSASPAAASRVSVDGTRTRAGKKQTIGNKAMALSRGGYLNGSNPSTVPSKRIHHGVSSLEPKTMQAGGRGETRGARRDARALEENRESYHYNYGHDRRDGRGARGNDESDDDTLTDEEEDEHCLSGGIGPMHRQQHQHSSAVYHEPSPCHGQAGLTARNGMNLAVTNENYAPGPANRYHGAAAGGSIRPRTLTTQYDHYGHDRLDERAGRGDDGSDADTLTDEEKDEYDLNGGIQPVRRQQHQLSSAIHHEPPLCRDQPRLTPRTRITPATTAENHSPGTANRYHCATIGGGRRPRTPPTRPSIESTIPPRSSASNNNSSHRGNREAGYRDGGITGPSVTGGFPPWHEGNDGDVQGRRERGRLEAGRGERGEEQEPGVSEPRSPPGSLISAMFSAWGEMSP